MGKRCKTCGSTDGYGWYVPECDECEGMAGDCEPCIIAQEIPCPTCNPDGKLHPLYISSRKDGKQ